MLIFLWKENKNNKNLAVLLFSISLFCDIVYRNVEFLNGRIFEKTAESINDSSSESNAQEEKFIISDMDHSGAKNIPTESEEKEPHPYQVKKITKGLVDNSWEITRTSDFIEK